MNVHGLFYSSCDAMGFPAHNREAVYIDGVSCGLAVLVDKGGGPKMLL